ncbi:MAG: hypothetical protein ABI682_07595 [Acidobacteriota bacterium]
MTGRLASLLASALFVFYCTAVGVYLLLHPWFPAHRLTFGISSSGFFRGFISGLGLVHLLAGLADIRGLARSLEPPVAEAAAPGDHPGPGPDRIAEEGR